MDQPSVCVAQENSQKKVTIDDRIQLQRRGSLDATVDFESAVGNENVGNENVQSGVLMLLPEPCDPFCLGRKLLKKLPSNSLLTK